MGGIRAQRGVQGMGNGVGKGLLGRRATPEVFGGGINFSGRALNDRADPKILVKMGYSSRRRLGVSKHTHHPPQVAVFFGGLSIKKDEEVLKKNCPHIVVGTPGRILALARNKSLNLKHIKHFILDECDKMLEQLGESREGVLGGVRGGPRHPGGDLERSRHPGGDLGGSGCSQEDPGVCHSLMRDSGVLGGGGHLRVLGGGGQCRRGWGDNPGSRCDPTEDPRVQALSPPKLGAAQPGRTYLQPPFPVTHPGPS